MIFSSQYSLDLYLSTQIKICQLRQNYIEETLMQLKEKIVHFIEQSSQKLKLTYQSTLQSIQIINVLDNHHSSTINKQINNNSFKAKCFAISTLNLCCKLYQTRSIHMRDYVKLIDPKYADFVLEHLSKNIGGDEEKEMDISSGEIQQLIKDYQITIMVQLRWKISMPLLYDQVIMIAFAWDKYTTQLIDFPLKFQSAEKDALSYSQNHNFLVKNIRICIYNFNHLIRNTNIENISSKIRKLALALFYANIKLLLKDHVKIHSYILSPKLSIAYLLSDFFKKHYNTLSEQISPQVSLISDVLQSYRLFREKSKQKKQGQIKKLTHKSNKHSQDKQNIMYYVNRLKNKSKGKKQINTDEKSQKYKSRSRSRKDCQKNTKDKQKLIKSKDSIIIRPHKKKSNSTKSIITRNFNVITKDKEKQKQPQAPQVKKQKKVIKYSKSKVSKRSEKSQITSKILPSSNLQNDFCTKSTYWLKSTTTLGKTDKKSTNSSIRMKMR